MRRFEDHNPIAVALCFAAIIGVCMVCMDPVCSVLSLLGGALWLTVRQGMQSIKRHGVFCLLFLAAALVNPLISHNGKTVLFVMNDNPVTLEALFYGIAASAMVVAVLYWFSLFSRIMTSDKLLYMFSAFSPKLALVLSMALRYVPLFGRQAKAVTAAQKALGLYKEDTLFDRFKGGTAVFSVLTTWALENGILTADSMQARGYGVTRRSRFALFRFRAGDTALLIAVAVLLTLTLIGVAQTSFVFYPAIMVPPMTVQRMIGYLSYGLLCLLPIVFEGKEALKWKYYLSKL